MSLEEIAKAIAAKRKAAESAPAQSVADLPLKEGLTEAAKLAIEAKKKKRTFA